MSVKKTIFIFLIFSVLIVSGQQHLLGIKAGVDISNVSLYPAQPQKGFSEGITYEYLSEKYYTFEVNLMYNQRDFPQSVMYFPRTLMTHYDYISFPLKTGFLLEKRTLFIFSNIGICPELLLLKIQTNKLGIYDSISKNYNTSISTNEISTFDLYSILEIGGGIKFNKKTLIYASIFYRQEIIHIDFANTYMIHNGTILCVGLKYSLTKK